MKRSQRVIADASVDGFADRHDAIEHYHELTKLTPHRMWQVARRVGAINASPELVRLTTAQNWKTYPAAPRLPLPRGAPCKLALDTALKARRSQTGELAAGDIDIEQLATLLRLAAGASGDGLHLRGSPSGGGLHPTEIYPVVGRVRGLEPGLYHYDVRHHALETLSQGPALSALAATMTAPEPVAGSAVTFVLTSVMPRALSKYLFRGYRVLSYDVGCVLQSLYLVATALGLGATAVGGFYDDEVSQTLGVDGVDECVMMTFVVGQPAPGPLARKRRAVIDR
jgi:SagB-type dehydrogenase family enzyme